MNIVFVSDGSILGSGYNSITLPVCQGLTDAGHTVRFVGLRYGGEQHDFPFSIYPCNDFNTSFGMVHNFVQLNLIDVLIVALDMPLQLKFLQMFAKREFAYIAITPLEAPPMMDEYVVGLQNAEKVFIISKFGTEEAKKAGLDAVHLPVGLDLESWRFPEEEERSLLRMSFGLMDDDFVVLTVADNQERKNLSASFEIFARFAEDKPNAKYYIVTRENLPVGWRLRSLARELGFEDKLSIFERGMGFKELWGLYVLSDVFLLTSKAEGLGMPLLEAMATKTPAVGVNHTGMSELLDDGRGYLISWEYMYRDPFGNQFRYFVFKEDGVDVLQRIYDGDTPDIQGAREFVEGRTWDKAVKLITDELEEYEKKDEPEALTSVQIL